MPKYFFDIHDGIDIRDDAGQDLPDIAAARTVALRRASNYVDMLDATGEGGYVVVTIRNEAGKVLRLRLVCQISESDPPEW